jgi:replicative DNA helicase
MAKINRDNFAYLGGDFQLRLVAQLLVDNRFAESIVEILSPNYFEDQALKHIVSTIKDAYAEHNVIPDMGSIEFRILGSVINEMDQKFAIGQLRKVQEANLNDSLVVQEQSMRFCKQQELKRSIAEIQAIIDKGDISKYEECEEILKKAMDHGDNKDNGMDVFDDIELALADDFRKPIPTGINGLDEIMDGGLSRGELAVILAPYGVGKSLPLSNRLYTPNGWVTMGDIKLGDAVIGRDGKPTNVIGVYPQGIRPIYRISFNDGTSTFCDKEHLWAVNSINQRNRSSWENGKRIKLKPDLSFKVVKTEDIINSLTYGGKKKLNYKIPMVNPVQFEEQKIDLNPYILGLLLGDGYMKSSSITTKDVEIIDNIRLIYGDEFISVNERCRDIDKGDILVQQCQFNVCIFNLTDKIKRLGLFDKKSDTKFIPKNYLYNSIKNRTELLQGLLDTDGTVNTRGGIEYCTVSEVLSNDVRELVLSLGGFCKIKTKKSYCTHNGVKKEGKLAYVLNISFPEKNNITPFKLSRKLNKIRNRVKYDDNKFIYSIEYSHQEEAQCIMVDNSEQLYVTDDYIVTHNTTMMTKIANSAKDHGCNVLQIFFEDMPKVVQRKHIACWSGFELNSLSEHREELMAMLKVKKSEAGQIRFKRFASDSTTIPMIRQYIRKKIAQGFRPDMIVLDYIDCVIPSTNIEDVNVGEGRVMRQFETLLMEFDMAGWTAVQGNRSSLDAEVVDGKMMGGSIKRGQIGHFVVSIAKTLDQKEEGTATMAIIKSRFAKDGMIFPDIKFDNSRMQIDLNAEKGAMTQVEYKKSKEKEESLHVATMLESMQRRKRLISSGEADTTITTT